MSIKSIKLSNGNTIPSLGLGVYQTRGKPCRDAVLHALKVGYRLIDSAEWYGNEKECGQAINEFIQQGSVKRADIFYTTKLQTCSTYEHAKSSIQQSLKACNLGYIDLYLIHSPYPNKQARLESWRAMQDAYNSGLIRNLGVSNYGIRHVQELLDSKPEIMPVVNQIDLHPFMTREADVKFNVDHGITLEAWGPLVRGERMTHPTIQKLARAHKKSPAQILISWSLQKGFICIPKSVKPHRIEENRDINFTLSNAEIEELSKLDEYLVTDWDPIGDDV